MKFIVIIFTSISIISCNSTTIEPIEENNSMLNSDDSLIGDSLKNVYYDDAYRLAINYYVKIDSSNIDSINIPKQYISDFYNGLIHIHNSKGLAQRDLVVDLYHVHTWVNPDLHAFNLYVDTSSSWIYKWAGASNYFTGYKELDSLMIKYNINILDVYFSNYSSIPYYVVTLFTRERMNIVGLMNYFRPLKGIIYAYERAYAGYGSDIRVEYDENKIIYKYHLGWNGCFAGACTRHYYWTFEVGFNGNVKFIESYGSALDNYPYF